MKKEREALLKRADGRHAHPYVPEIADNFVKGAVDRRTFLRTVTLLGVAAPAAYLFAGLAEGRPPAPAARAAAPKRGGTFRFAMEVQAITDPATFDWPQQSNITRGIVEYLTRTGPDNVTLPYLAESWEASDDLRTWTFKLRRNVIWSNGDPFDADDVVFNIRRWLSPELGSSNLGLLSGLTESVEVRRNGQVYRVARMRDGAVEKAGSHTVRLHLASPNLAIPESLFSYPAAILHRRFVEEGGDLARNPVGTGPFALERHRVGEEALLVRREGYWGSPPWLDAIHFIDTGTDRGAMAEALIAGEVDGIHEADVGSLDALNAAEGIAVQPVMTARTGVCRMRVDRPPFDDRRVREAITLPLNHRELLDRGYRGRGVRAENHHVGPMHPEYAKLPWRKPDPERARHLLAEAGYPDGIEVTLDVGQTEGPWELATAQAMQEQLAAAGIRMTVNAVPAADYWRSWRETPFGLTAWTHRPLGVMALNLGYRSGQSWNESRYANPEFDRALDAANGELDPDRRRTKMETVQGILQGDHVIAQPFWRDGFTATRDDVRGFRAHPTQFLLFEDVWLDR